MTEGVDDVLNRARAFAEPFLAGESLDTGENILDHADAPGFSLEELHRLSQLVLGHRGKLRKMEAWFSDATFMRQLLALRLAVILAHAHRDPKLEGLRLQEAPSGLQLVLPPGWARAFPQSMHLLSEEALAWQKTPWPLQMIEA